MYQIHLAAPTNNSQSLKLAATHQGETSTLLKKILDHIDRFTEAMRFRHLAILLMLLAVAATTQAILTSHPVPPYPITNYNNYVIFKQSFFHLLNGQDLYAKYKFEYWDLYKYSPTFAALMAPMAVLPDAIGLLIWNLLNVVPILWGLRALTSIQGRVRIFTLLFIALELFTQLQNEQSNGLLLGLVLMALALAEKNKMFWSVLCLCLCAYIKVLGLAAFAMYLFYPRFWRTVVYGIFWTVLLGALPLLCISFDTLWNMYVKWLMLLQKDHNGPPGLSVMTLLHHVLHWHPAKWLVQVASIVMFCIPLVLVRHYSSPIYRINVVCSALIWMVIFNHKAESPTFILAAAGVGLWYFVRPSTTWMHRMVLMLAWVMTQLSSTDIFPEHWQTGAFTYYAFKAIPCVVVWVMIQVDFWRPAMLSPRESDGFLTA